MKHGKALITGLLAVATMATVGCNAKSKNVASNKEERIAYVANIKRSFANPIDGVDKAIFPTILGNIATSGPNILSSAIGVGVKYIATNILLDYGFDMRDPSIQYLEKVLDEIKEVKTKLDTINEKLDVYHAEDSLKTLYQYVLDAQIDVFPLVNRGLWKLAQAEADTALTEEEKEARRVDFYNTSLKDFKIDGRDITKFVTHFATAINQPNASSNKDIFYYYQLTSGQYDKWSTQSYVNRRNYIAYLDTLLLSSANIAIFDYQYRYANVGEASKGVAEQNFNDMIKAVSDVNGRFQKELNRLEEYETLKKEKGEIIYLPTGVHYSTRLATLTFNNKDKDRQGLIKGITNKGVAQDFVLAYEPNQEMLSNIIKDYKDCAAAIGDNTYTLKNYLKGIGFYAKDNNLFESAKGLYQGNFENKCSGYLNDDANLRSSYYDDQGNIKTTTQFFCEAHHGIIAKYADYVIKCYASEYYLCLVRADQQLDGGYELKHLIAGRENMPKQLYKEISLKEDYEKAQQNTDYFKGKESVSMNEAW